MAFAISAAFTGLAGALYAHKLLYISPEAFTIFMSIELLLMVVIGGLGSCTVSYSVLHSSFFCRRRSQFFETSCRRWWPNNRGGIGLLWADSGPGHFIRALGMYGRWLKIKHYFSVFPLYRKSTFKRQKSYTRMTSTDMALVEVNKPGGPIWRHSGGRWCHFPHQSWGNLYHHRTERCRQDDNLQSDQPYL
ncbi:MAG: hypothetical protein Ct9H300mP16_14910 [Pseudomonadota bacterium]|nr:MAG: hypothetical protein Ct9H300mP16_14910 [Pseudomonadota bacterium]